MNSIIQDPQVHGSIVRELSIHEASFPVYGELSPGGGNIVVCLQLQGQLSQDQATDGFQQLMQAEASLQVASQWLERDARKGRREGYYFIKPNNPILPFSAEIFEGNTSECDNENTRKEDNDFSENTSYIRTKLLNQPFKVGSLLWRAHLVSEKSSVNKPQKHCVYLCINHSVSDGISVYHLMKRWLLALHPSTNISATFNEFSLPLWHYMPKRISGFWGAFRSLSIIPIFMKAQNLANNGLNFKADCNAPIAEHRCRSAYRILDKPFFSRLLKLSRSNKKSVHGLISSALLQIFLTDNKNQGKLKNIPDKFNFPFLTTVNARDKIQGKHNKPLNIDDAIAGCLSSGVTSTVKINKKLIDVEYRKSPWQLGDQISSGIAIALKKNQHWKVLRVYKLIGLKGLKKFLINGSEKPLATPISFANLGAVKFDFYINRAETNNNEILTVKGYQAYAAFHASGAGINAVVNTLNGELTLCLTCPDPIISQQTLDRYADDVIDLLKDWSLLPHS